MNQAEKQALEKRLIQCRRTLHEHPELSHREYETTERIRRWLVEMGAELAEFGLETGVVARIRGKHPGKTVVLRADIDALPITEQTGEPFASKTAGVMHACGHDVHTSILLGAVELLLARQEELCGTVLAVFQPAEESATGARVLLDKGVFDGVDAVFGGHTKPDLPVGTLGVRAGALMSAVDQFRIVLKGRGGHEGMPHRCIDPLAAGSQLVCALQTIVSRNVSPLEQAVVSVTHFSSGSTWNVLPEQAELEGTVRTFSPAVRTLVEQRIRCVSAQIAQAFGTALELEWIPKLPAVTNAAQWEPLVVRTAERLGLRVVEAEQSLGGEDFALYQERVPGFFVWIGTEGAEEWHHPAYHVDERAILPAAEYFAELAVSALAEGAVR